MKTPRKYLDAYLSGSCFDMQTDCNSKFRELQRARDRNDKEGEIFWRTRIRITSYVTDLLFIAFYRKENEIKTEQDFNDFINLFMRFATMKTGRSWINICYAGK